MLDWAPQLVILAIQICFVHQAAFDETEHRASDACGNVARLVYIKDSWPNTRVDFRLACASTRGKLMPSLSRTADLLISVLAFAMAILEFLLKCFRRRSPRSEQTRPLCTEEDSVQPEVTGDLQPVTPIHTEDECPKPVTPSAKLISTFEAPLAQHDSPPQQLRIKHDSGFVFPGAFPAQVCAEQCPVCLHIVASWQSLHCLAI